MKEQSFINEKCYYHHLGTEEVKTIFFQGTESYDTRLCQYLESPEMFQPNICTTKTFRHYLRRYIRTFKPEKLVPDKDLWLYLEKDGCFAVRQGKTKEERLCLSETEEQIFRYLCFFHVRSFWDEIRKRSRFPKPKLPVVIRDFSNRLDETVDFSQLLQRAMKITDQVFLWNE